MASLGIRTVNEMVGRADLLEMRHAVDHWKTTGLDFSSILTPAEIVYEGTEVYQTIEQDHGLDKALDNLLIELAQPALKSGERVIPIGSIGIKWCHWTSFYIRNHCQVWCINLFNYRLGTEGNDIGC